MSVNQKKIVRKKPKRKASEVITGNNAYKLLKPELSIDKITLRSEKVITKETFHNYFDKNHIAYEKDKRLKNETATYVLGCHLIYLKNTKNYISRLTTNPNNFSSLFEYKENVEQLDSNINLEMDE